MQVIDRVVLGSQFEKYWLRLFILNWEIFSNSSRKYINLRSWCFSHLLSIHLALYHVESVEKKQACILYLRQGPAGVSSTMHLCVRKRCSASIKLWPMWELVQRMHKRAYIPTRHTQYTHKGDATAHTWNQDMGVPVWCIVYLMCASHRARFTPHCRSLVGVFLTKFIISACFSPSCSHIPSIQLLWRWER